MATPIDVTMAYGLVCIAALAAGSALAAINLWRLEKKAHKETKLQNREALRKAASREAVLERKNRDLLRQIRQMKESREEDISDAIRYGAETERRKLNREQEEAKRTEQRQKISEKCQGARKKVSA